MLQTVRKGKKILQGGESGQGGAITRKRGTFTSKKLHKWVHRKGKLPKSSIS